MGRRKALTEAVVLAVCHSTGRFAINPLAYRNYGRVKLLESMRKRGLLQRRDIKLNWREYTLAPVDTRAKRA